MIEEPSSNSKNQDIVGHEASLKLLESFALSEKLPSAIILSGNKGLGKMLSAINFSKKLLSPQGIDDDKTELLFGEEEFIPSEKSLKIDIEVSSLVDSNTHPDLKIIRPEEGKSAISVEETRKINGFFSQSSSIAKNKIVIIDSADDLNINSANSILKILEEPNKNSLIILISHDKYSLLPTIRSRCVEVDFFPLSEQEFFKILELNEQNNLDRKIYKASNGSPGKALSILDSNILEITEEFFEILEQGSTPISEVVKLVGLVKKDGSQEFFEIFVLAHLKQMVLEKKIVPETFSKISKIFSQIKTHNMDLLDCTKSIISTYKYAS